MTATGWIRMAPIICAIFAVKFACAQNYPIKPVRIVTSAAGGTSDFVSRVIAQGLSPALSQQVVVDNRGGGAVPVEIVAKAAPDGYTLLYYGSTLWLLPLMQDVSYDPLRDFIPVSITVTGPILLFVHPSLPVKSVNELIALAKARPGELNYGSASAGSAAHLATELLKTLAKIDMVRINFKGVGPALNGLLAGEVQVLMTGASGMAPHVSSGRLRALAVSSAKRFASLPNLPTMAEAGVPGYEYGQPSGIFAPARTSAAIVDQLNKEVVRVVNRADIKEKLFNSGNDVVGGTSQEAVAMIKSEVARLGKVIKEAKIRAE